MKAFQSFKCGCEERISEIPLDALNVAPVGRMVCRKCWSEKVRTTFLSDKEVDKTRNQL